MITVFYVFLCVFGGFGGLTHSYFHSPYLVFTKTYYELGDTINKYAVKLSYIKTNTCNRVIVIF